MNTTNHWQYCLFSQQLILDRANVSIVRTQKKIELLISYDVIDLQEVEQNGN